MKKILVIFIITLLFSVSVTGQAVTERRYSSEIENGDKFTFKIQVYTRAGNDVTEEGNHFGKVVADSRVEITATKDPSSDNLVNQDQNSKMLDIFKIEVDNNRLSSAQNLGIIYHFIMPTQVLLDDDSSKHFINKYYTELGADISTDSKKDTFQISLGDITMDFGNGEVNITSWNLTYQRNNGVLQDMDLRGLTPSDDTLELQVEYLKGFFQRLFPFQFWVIIPGLIVLTIITRHRNRSLDNKM